MKRDWCRNFRFDSEGRRVRVWPSGTKLMAMGKEEGAKAFREGREPIRLGNLAYDQAAREECDRLKAGR